MEVNESYSANESFVNEPTYNSNVGTIYFASRRGFTRLSTKK